MDKLRKEALQVAKEVALKFIETGRISPNNFAEHFAEIFAAVLATVGAADRGGQDADDERHG